MTQINNFWGITSIDINWIPIVFTISGVFFLHEINRAGNKQL